MKQLLTLLLVLFFAVPAHAEERGVSLLVIDQDPKGTNVRDAPGGNVTRVIPFHGKTDAEIELRRVAVLERNGQWFRVRLDDGSSGWMHASVLGSCASATEDGDPSMMAKPDDDSAIVATVKAQTFLRLLDVRFPDDRGGWAKMEYTTASGKKRTGWMMEHTLASNPHNECRPR